MNKILFVVVMLALLVSCSADVSVEISQSDEANFGDPNGILFWNYEEKVAGFRNIDKFGQTRLIPAGDSPYPLPKSAMAHIGHVRVPQKQTTRLGAR
jgi:hypothetical protein